MTGGAVRLTRFGEEPQVIHAGWADVRGDRATSGETIYRLYSMTKPVVALATLIALQKHRLSPQLPLRDLIPEFAGATVWDEASGGSRPAASPITIHHMLTHTAGFTYGFGGEGPVARAYLAARTDFNPTDGPLEEVVERLAQLPLVADPGRRWTYGVSLDVIGRVLEVLENARLDEVIRDLVTTPLGTPELAFAAIRPGELADLCRLDEADLVVADDDGVATDFPGKTLSGGAGMVGTIEAYGRFVDALADPPLGAQVWDVSPQVIAGMMLPRIDGDLASWGASSFNETATRGVGFGFGGSVVLDPEVTAWNSSVGEFAWGGYASTAFWIDPVRRVHVVFMTQVIPSDGNSWRANLREIVGRHHGAGAGA